MAISKKIRQQIFVLHKQGFPDNRVAEILGIGKTTARAYRKAAALAPNGHKMQQEETKLKVMNGRGRCEWCKKWKIVSDFITVAKVCKRCLYDRTKKHLHTNLKRYFSKKVAFSRCWAKDHELPFNLKADHLLDLYKTQKGRCFYTDRRIIPGIEHQNKRHTISLDRIIPHKGYVKGNVVLCSGQANLIKNDQTLADLKLWMPDWYDRIQKFQGRL